MSPRNKRLEQAKPKGDSPAKIAKRKNPTTSADQGRFEVKDLPRGKITQNRAKPGMTSPQ